MALILTPAQFSRRVCLLPATRLADRRRAGSHLGPPTARTDPPGALLPRAHPAIAPGVGRRFHASRSPCGGLTRGGCRSLTSRCSRPGEQSGRLDACFRLLADYYADRARIARQLIADLAYPAFLLHFAVFMLPFSQFFLSGNWVRYLCRTFGVLLPIYAAIALVVYAAQGRHSEGWRALVERLLRPVPFLGAARRDLALGQLAAALEALLNAGVTVVEAWELAGAASGSPALRRAVLAWRPLVDGGRTPAETLRASRSFPSSLPTSTQPEKSAASWMTL